MATRIAAAPFTTKSIVSDPAVIDWNAPPAIANVSFASQGVMLNGILYISAGLGPHPTVILLHGYPGDEKNLDLAQAIRRAGWNVLFFHYRGAWGSAGAYSIENAIEDALAAHDFLLQPSVQDEHRVDASASRVALVGHSMGGYVALRAAMQRPALQRVAAMSAVNIGQLAQGAQNPAIAAFMAAIFEQMAHGVIQGADWPAQFERMSADPTRYDVVQRAAELDGKSILLVGATRDQDVAVSEHLEPLAAQLSARGQARLSTVILNSDHVYSNARIALAREVVAWLNDE
jgi:pimeloyl-ACP methyl ester carboxylesterase